MHVGDACVDKEACLKMDGLMKCTVVPPKYQSLSPPISIQQKAVILSVQIVRHRTERDKRMPAFQQCSKMSGWHVDQRRSAIDGRQRTKCYKFKKCTSTKSRDTIRTRVKAASS